MRTVAAMSVPPPPPPGGLTPPPFPATQDTWHRPIAPIAGLSKALWIMVGIQVPLQFVSAVLTWRLGRQASDFVAGKVSEADFRHDLESPVTAITSLLIIPIAVITIVWMYRMASNVRAAGRQQLRWTPQWAIWGWFVPPCAVYAVPWLMFTELWKASDPEVPAYDPSWKQRAVSPLVHAWWVLYGLVPLVGLVTSVNVVSQFRTSDDIGSYAEQLDRFGVLNSVLGLFMAAAAVVYFLLVRALSDRHMRFIREA